MSGLHLNERAPIVVFLTAVLLLLPTVGVCSAQQDRGALMLVEVQLSGLTALRDCNPLVHFIFNNVTDSKRVELKTGDELKVTSCLKAPASKPSVLQVQAISQEQRLFNLKVIIDEGHARVVEAYADTTTLKPLEARELVHIKLNAGLAKVVVELPLLLSGSEEIVAQVGGKIVDVEVSKSKSATMLTLTTMVDVDEEPPFALRVLSHNLTLIEILGRISAKNSSDVTVRGIIKTVHVKLMKGRGLLELGLPTSLLQPMSFNERGIIYEGIAMTLEPLVNIEEAREVKIRVVEKLTWKVVEGPLSFSLYLKVHKAWLNFTAPSQTTALIPREDAVLYVSAEGYKAECVEVPANASEVHVALESEKLAPLGMALRALEAVWSWLSNYWILLLAFGMGVLIALIFRR